MSIKRNRYSLIKQIISTFLAITLVVSSSGIVIQSEKEPIDVYAASSQDFGYTGGVQTFTAGTSGAYFIEVWGAQGGGAYQDADGRHGYGGYSYGIMKLKQGDKLSVLVGKQGTIGGGYSYGGGAASNSSTSGSGGGASAVAKYQSGSYDIDSIVNNGRSLIVAGGGGGIGANTLTADQGYFRHRNRIGNGGGILAGSGTDMGVQVHGWLETWHEFTWVFATILHDKAIGNSGQVYGAGSGGGGYRGGNGGADKDIAGGAGGTGFIDTANVIGYTAENGTIYKQGSESGYTAQDSQVRTGNGFVRIRFIEQYHVTVDVMLNNKATYPGDSAVCLKKSLKVLCDTNINIPNPSTINGVQFTGYVKTSGDGTLSGNNFHVGMGDAIIAANFNSNGIQLSVNKLNNTTIRIGWSDYGALYYSVLQGIDKNGLDDAGYDNLCEEYILGVSSGWTEFLNGTYDVTTEGLYEVYAAGQQGTTYNYIGGSDPANSGAPGSGANHYATMFLRNGDKLTTSIYPGGIGGRDSGDIRNNGGNGGNGVGINVNGTTVMGAGGGGGATSGFQFADDGFAYHYNHSYSGENAALEVTSRNNGTTTTGYNGRTQRYEDLLWMQVGGGGGGWPYGGNDDPYPFGGAAGCSGLAGEVNGFATNSTSGKTWIAGTEPTLNTGRSSGSSSEQAKIRLVGILGVTADTSGTYTLKDKQAPTTPQAGAAGGCTISSNDREYTISWKESTDIGSDNLILVKSYDSSRTLLHQLGHTEKYTSGLSHYLYKIDTNAGTQINGTGTVMPVSNSQAERSIKVAPAAYNQYIHIAAVDRAGNISGTLTIRVPGEKLIVYNDNRGQLTNKYGDTFTTFPSGKLNSQKLQEGDVVNIHINAGDITRVGYYQSLSDNRYVYNTKPDGTGTTYYGGQKISYSDISGAVLELYLIWEPIVYEVRLNKNVPDDSTNAISMSTSGWAAQGTIEAKSETAGIGIGSNSLAQVGTGRPQQTEYYNKTFRYDQSSEKVPVSSCFSLKGWHTDNKWYTNKVGTNGAASGELVLWTNPAYNLTSTHLATLTGYPKWIKNKYTIHYNYNNTTKDIYGEDVENWNTAGGGSGVVPDTQCEYDTNVTLRDGHEFSKVGYILKGWSLKSTGVTNTDEPGNTVDRVVYSLGATLTKPNFTDVDGGEVTLYAVWEPIRYEVKYDPYKGTTHASHASAGCTSGTADYHAEYRMKSYTEEHGEMVRYNQWFNLQKNDYIRKYMVTLQNAEPWILDKKSVNGNVNSASKWVNYPFAGWKQDATTGSSPYYEVADSTGLFADQQRVRNLTTVNNATVTMYASWKSNTIDLPSTVAGSDRYNFVNWSDAAYGDTRLYDKTIHNNTDPVGYTVAAGQKYKPYRDISLYAHWWRELSLNLDLTGGIYRDKIDKNILTMKGVEYDYEDGYNFNIINGLTAQSKGHYDKQTEDSIDLFSTYDSNGINTYFRKYVDGETYRLLGWQTASGQAEPVWNMSPYNPSHLTTYKIPDNFTLYAVWEPILQVEFEFKRELGDIPLIVGNIIRPPESEIHNTTSVSTDKDVDMVIRTGEEGVYKITTRNDAFSVTTVFDKNITDIYDIEGTWTDTLNPSTPENMLPNQNHGLNRQIITDGEETTRSFHIPNYLGSPKSYPGNDGKYTYFVQFNLAKPSYYWQNIKHQPAESIQILGTIHLLTSEGTGDQPGVPGTGEGETSDKTISDLRSKIRTTAQ